MYNMDEYEMNMSDLEDAAISCVGIKQYLEMVDPEIKEMFIRTYGNDPDVEFGFNDDKRQQMEKILELLSEMRPREQNVLALRFGLFTGKPMTLEEVAAKFGVTRERIRQIEAKALRRKGHHLVRRKKLRDFLDD